MTKSIFLNFFTGILVFCSTSLFAISNPDSVLTVARNPQQSIQNRIRAYSKLVYHFETIDTDKAIQYGNDALALPIVDSLNQDEADLYVTIAFVYNARQEYPEAIAHHKKAVEFYQKAGNKKREALICKNIGILNRKIGNYPEAIKYQMIGLGIFEELQDTVGQVDALMNIGNIYIFQEQPELAEPYFKKSYILAMQQNNPLVIADATNSYAVMYDHLGINDTAEIYYLQALQGYIENKRWIKKTKVEHNLAMIYLEEEQFDKAEEMLLASLSIFKQAPSRFQIEIATVKLNLGKVYMFTDRYNLATPILKEALTTFEEKGAKTEAKTCYSYLAKSLAKQGQFEDAFYYQEAYTNLKDSIQNSEITTNIIEITEKYESEKKEKEILELQNEANLEAKYRWTIISIGIAIISLLIILFLVYRQRSIKEAEKTKLRLQQYAKEMDLLRHKIEKDTIQYMLPNEYSIKRDDVNTMLEDELSDRELDVFMLLLEGHTNKTIGEKLFVSVNTIKYHLQKIYHKLDVGNRSDAIKSVSKTDSLLKVS